MVIFLKETFIMADDAGQQFMFTTPRERWGTKRSASQLILALWLIGIFLVEGVASGITWPTVLQRLQLLSSRTGSTAGSSVKLAYFVSSGLLSANPQSSQGITDQLVIELNNIPSPPPDKSYYAWLLSNTHSEATVIPLGALTVSNGTINFAYPGDALHSNLLTTFSRFLITEEDSTSLPSSPSLNPTTWLYYAEFSQTPNPADTVNHYSLYDHIRHLLSDDPKVKAAGLSGGLDIWLYRNTQKVLEWAGSARDAQKSGDAGFIRRQLTRIMDYLDGTTYTQLAQDLPGQGVLADPAIAKIGLLTFAPATQSPPGYLYHIGKHLHEVSQLPQASTEQRALANRISQEMNVVNEWFLTMRAEALQLYHMTDAQLVGSNARPTLV